MIEPTNTGVGLNDCRLFCALSLSIHVVSGSCDFRIFVPETMRGHIQMWNVVKRELIVTCTTGSIYSSLSTQIVDSRMKKKCVRDALQTGVSNPRRTLYYYNYVFQYCSRLMAMATSRMATGDGRHDSTRLAMTMCALFRWSDSGAIQSWCRIFREEHEQEREREKKHLTGRIQCTLHFKMIFRVVVEHVIILNNTQYDNNSRRWQQHTECALSTTGPLSVQHYHNQLNASTTDTVHTQSHTQYASIWIETERQQYGSTLHTLNCPIWHVFRSVARTNIYIEIYSIAY